MTQRTIGATAINATASAQSSTLITALFVAALGAGLLFLSGFANSATLHDAAHDLRHASGFPCH